MKRDRSKYCHFQQEKCSTGTSEGPGFKIRLLQAAPFRNVPCHSTGYLETFEANAYAQRELRRPTWYREFQMLLTVEAHVANPTF